MNDPFDGGMHLQDIFVFKPVHLEGELIGFTCTTAHHGDVGGRLPGSSACDNTEIFQEGIRLPWLRLYAEGEPVEDVFKIIEANVRIPRMTFGDLGAQVAASSVAERALVALAERHGVEGSRQLMTALIDYTELLVRQEIATWPDGTASFTDYLGSDGVERSATCRSGRTVTIAGDEVTADLTDSSPMVRGSLNSHAVLVQACVYQAVRCALTVEVPNTAGAFRPIHVLTKPGTVADVVMPGASSMRGVTGFRILDAVSGALAQLLPDRVPAAGEGGNTLAIFGAERPGGGDRFIFYELIVGTWGGTPEADGNDGLTNPAEPGGEHPGRGAPSPSIRSGSSDTGSCPTAAAPAGIAAASPSSASGAASHRETSLIVRSDRAKHPPYGLARGGPGARLGERARSTPTEREETLPPMFSTEIEAGDVYEHRTAGGGGWGDPFQRDPGRGRRRRLNEKVSPEAALELYGVEITADGTGERRSA